MLTEQTITTMNALKLYGMARGFNDRLGSPQHSDLSHAEFVGLLVQDEKTNRDNQKLKRLLHNAKLKQTAALEDINYTHQRGLKKQAIIELSSPQWILDHRPVLLTGPTGVGKSFIACALGNFAARAGYTVLYIRAPRLFAQLHQSRGDGTHLKTIQKLAKAAVLIVDDFLITPLAETERRDMLEIIEDRYMAGSTVLTSQCPLKEWHHNIGDPTLADAICDRLFHKAHKIEMRGPSIR
jgi:DNA replication protein DnaC